MDDINGKPFGIYIDLDCLLDTRMGTILQHFNDDEIKLALDSNYFTRIEDKFTGISKERFKQAYSKRDKVTLKNSIASKAIILINKLISLCVKNAVTTPVYRKPKIILNVYPYVLSEEEINVFIEILAQVTIKLADIVVINSEDKFITPVYLKEQLEYVIKYEYGPWLDMHNKSFEALKCPEISLIVPGLYFDRLPTSDELDKIKHFNTEPFRLMEQLSSPFINLKLHDIELFNANINKT